MVNKSIFVLFFTLILLSCKREVIKEELLSDLIEKEYPSEKNLIDSVTLVNKSHYYVPLEMIEESNQGEIVKVITTDDKIITVSRDPVRPISTEILFFDKKGKYLNKISSLGRGPGEYIEISSVDMKGDTTVILDIRSRKYLYFDSAAKFVKEIGFTDYLPDPFVITKSNKFVNYVSCPDITPGNDEVIFTDAQGIITNSYFPREGLAEGQIRIGMRDYFSKNSNGIYFIPVFEDKMYSIDDKDNIVEVFDFKFKDNMFSFSDVTDESFFDKNDKYMCFSDFFIADNGNFVTWTSIGRKKLVFVYGNIHTKKLGLWEGGINMQGVYKDYFVAAVPDNYYLLEKDKYIPRDSSGNGVVVIYMKSDVLFE